LNATNRVSAMVARALNAIVVDVVK
jgi:hypothetical protein